ncbi:MAG: hypothetical protein AAGH15_22970 [Myxococcota bacterium]
MLSTLALAPALAAAQTPNPFTQPQEDPPPPPPPQAPSGGGQLAPPPPPPGSAGTTHVAPIQPPPPVANRDARGARNVVFVEGLGAGLFWSLNYERFLTKDLALRFGFGVTRFTDPDFEDTQYTFLAIPVLLSFTGVDNASGGNGAHHLNLSAGFVAVYVSETVDDTFTADGSGGLGVLEASYRYQPRDGGFMFRSGPQLLIGAGIVQVWWSLALGGAF